MYSHNPFFGNAGARKMLLGFFFAGIIISITITITITIINYYDYHYYYYY